jgi:hypothetical protein
MKKVFYVMVATTILATNPLLAMDGPEERPTNPPAKPLHKSAKILGCVPDQSGGITLSFEQLARLTNSGKLLRRNEDGSLYRVNSGNIYDIELSKEGMTLMNPYTSKEQGEKDPTLGSLPLKLSALAVEDRSQKIHFSRKASKNVKFISEPCKDNDEGPMFRINRVSAKQLYREQEWAAEKAAKKSQPFMDLEKIERMPFQTISEWISTGRKYSMGGWIIQLGGRGYHMHIDEDAGLQDNDILYFEPIGEKEVVYESKNCFPKLCSFQEEPPANYLELLSYGPDYIQCYFAGYVTGKSPRAPVAFISYIRPRDF